MQNCTFKTLLLLPYIKTILLVLKKNSQLEEEAIKNNSKEINQKVHEK